MIELDNLKVQLGGYEQPLKELRASLDIENKRNRIMELEREMEAPDFWNDANASSAKTKELKSLKDDLSVMDSLMQQYEDIEAYIELGNETPDGDPEILSEALETFAEFEKSYDAIRLKTLLSGEFDADSAIVTLHSGAGGTEACDWVSMLYRMYTRWAADHGFGIEELDLVEGDEAGIQSVTFQVDGENAYGYLKSEKGVHRLVRISPFNAAGKRQTSFASCEVMPDIEEDIDIEIKDEDIRIDTYRSSGAGGQHINKTSSAIRITHFPTGIVVQCQNERSQHMNKDKAMQMLKSKLLILKQEENEAKAAGIRGEVKDIAWGNQIRSYVMQPYKLVTDLRTGEKQGNVDAVMDGALDPFINGYLKWLSLGCPPRNAQDAE